VTWKPRALRAERTAAFAGAYEPLDLGGGIVAYVRGGEVLVAGAVAPDVAAHAPDGWADLLDLDGLVLAVRATR
jgi:hypothetical protein